MLALPPSLHRVTRARLYITLGLVLILLSPYVPASRAQEMQVPVDLQVALFSKILSFDRKLERGPEKQIDVGILFQRKFRPSIRAKADFMAAVADAADSRVRFRCFPIEATDLLEVEQRLAAGSLDVLYVAPLRSFDLAGLSRITRERDVRTIGVPEYVEQGLSVGLATRTDKPLILVNLKAARAEGAEYASRLLRLAKIVHPE